MSDNHIELEPIDEEFNVEAIVEEEPEVIEPVIEEKTWQPVAFEPIQRADYGTKTQVRMSNIKSQADNEEMALVRKALHEKYPHAVPPGTVYDYDVTRGTKKLQKSLGHPVNGILTREDVVELGKAASTPFTVV
jgi:hypothetical protein